MLAPWKENYDKSRQSVKKQRRYFADKMLIVKAMVFLVVMYRCENRAIKKAVCQRIGPFELWCWRRLLRVSWTEKRSNQAILKEVNHEYSLERLTMKLKLQYFGHLMQRWKRPWYWERLRAGGEGDNRGWDGWKASPTQWIWVWANWEIVKDREALWAVVHEVAKRWKRLSNWTTTQQQLSLEPLFKDI